MNKIYGIAHLQVYHKKLSFKNQLPCIVRSDEIKLNLYNNLVLHASILNTNPNKYQFQNLYIEHIFNFLLYLNAINLLR